MLIRTTWVSFVITLRVGARCLNQSSREMVKDPFLECFVVMLSENRWSEFRAMKFAPGLRGLSYWSPVSRGILN